ncbi:GWxTD domain-containing protein [candidate division KSB1 bacterium]|nr:GWxTD domain-containing protein [candidate division KSB1 bacterium]
MKHHFPSGFHEIFVIIFLSLFIVASDLSAQTAREYYDTGLEFRKQDKIDEAIDAFRDAIARDRAFADAYYELALTYKLQTTLNSFIRAKDALKEAQRFGDDDIKYLTALALLNEDRYKNGDALSTWKKIQKDEPDNLIALEGLARLYEKQLNEFKYRVDPIAINRQILDESNPVKPEHYFYDKNLVEYSSKIVVPGVEPLTLTTLEYGKKTQLMPPILWYPLVARNDSLARFYNERILELDPGNRDALYRLGLLYYDRIVYQSSRESGDLLDGYRRDNRSLDTFVRIFGEIVKNHPDDKDAHLFLGLGYTRIHEYDLAVGYFNKAKSLMSEKEKAVFVNSGLLKTGGLENVETGRDENDEKFFYQRDPLFMTAYNERELEHYSRVAEANLRFSVPRRNIEGWRTDQGRMLIKYGIPKNRTQYKNLSLAGQAFEYNDVVLFYGNNSGNSSLGGSAINRVNAIYRSLKDEGYVESGDKPNYTRDYWHYDDFTFVFEKPLSEKDNLFSLGNWREFNFDEIAREVEKEFPEFYKYEPKGEFIDFAYDYATFRGETGATLVEVYYGIPVNKLKFEKEGNFYIVGFKSGVFLHDSNWNRSLEDIQQQGLRFPENAIDITSDDVAVFRLAYNVRPDNYHFAIELLDANSDNVGTYREDIVVEEYGYEELQLSGIQLAWNIDIIDPLNIITKSNLKISANPRRIYRLNQPIFIYYEIYNLLPEDVTGGSEYTVEYAIQYTGEKEVSLTGFIRNLFVNRDREMGITTKFTQRGAQRNESQFLRIDQSLSEPGPYRLTLMVTDMRTGKTAEKSVDFLLSQKN